LEVRFKINIIFKVMCPTSSSQPRWTNLLKWLRGVHSGESFNPIQRPQVLVEQTRYNYPLELIIISGMFHMAENLRNSPWDVVKKILKQQRMILGGANDKWR
jgi:hypothetical protein